MLAKFVNLRIIVPIHMGTVTRDESGGLEDDDSEWEEGFGLMEYGKELKRSLSSQSLASWSNTEDGGAGGMGSCWSFIAGESSGGGAGSSSSRSKSPAPSYNSEWNGPIETRNIYLKLSIIYLE